jgi:hypothetical protein
MQSVPQLDRRYVLITQMTDPAKTDPAWIRHSPTKFVPPNGSILITGRRYGYLVRDGVHISIQAPDEASVLEAARALRPLSAGSGDDE